MHTSLTAKRISDDSLSTAMPVWTNSTLADNQDAVLSTSKLIFTDLHDSSVASRTADNHYQSQKMKSSEIPAYTESVTTETSTSSSDDITLITDHLQLDHEVEMRTSSAQNVVVPVGIVTGSILETTMNTETEDSSVLLNYAMPLRGDSVMHSMLPKDVSHTHIAGDVQKTSVLHDATATRGTGHVSTSYERSSSLQSSSVPSTLQKSSIVTAEIQTEISHRRSSSSRSWFTAVQETTSTSQSSVASDVRHIDDYTSAVYHSGEYHSINQSVSYSVDQNHMYLASYVASESEVHKFIT